MLSAHAAKYTVFRDWLQKSPANQALFRSGAGGREAQHGGQDLHMAFRDRTAASFPRGKATTTQCSTQWYYHSMFVLCVSW